MQEQECSRRTLFKGVLVGSAVASLTSTVGSCAPQSELEQTQKFVSENIVKAEKGRKCIDGRYSAAGMLARPGGDFGYILSLMAVNNEKDLGMHPIDIFETGLTVITTDGDPFHMHTDHHTETLEQQSPQNPDALIGCGHIKNAANEKNAAAYGVKGSEVREVVKYAKEMAKQSNEIEIVTLPGKHREKGVLLVESEQVSVRSSSPESDSYYVYDRVRDNEFLQQFIDRLHIPQVSYKDIKRASDKQLTASLHYLAPGEEIYKVSVKQSGPEVSLLTKIR